MPTTSSVKAKWIIATSVGWLIGVILVILFAMAFEGLGIHNMQFFMGLGLGAGIGYMQWRMLGKWLGMGAEWLWLTITGLTLPFLSIDLLKLFSSFSPSGNAYLLYSIASAGLTTGLFQFFALKKDTRRSWPWIFGSLFSWSAAGIYFLTINYTTAVSSHNMVLFALNLFIILTGGLVLGIISSIFLPACR